MMQRMAFWRPQQLWQGARSRARIVAPLGMRVTQRHRFASSGRGNLFDPFQLLASELNQVKEDVHALVDSADPALASIAKYYFASPQPGKHLRPLLILLVSQATAAPLSPDHYEAPRINTPISAPDILDDPNPFAPLTTASITPDATILPAQQRLAAIAELLHVASLLHDDVIDSAETRRGQLSAPLKFGGKLSIFAGDFLVARASMALARLGNSEVNKLVSSISMEMIEGEIVQLATILNKSPSSYPSAAPDVHLQDPPIPHSFDETLFDAYRRKNYLKTASIISKFCQAAVLLSPISSQDESLVTASYEYGNHLGLAFQIVDDILNFTGSNESYGRAGDWSDLKSGLITAPALFAWKECGSKFGELVSRGFKDTGDLDLAGKMIDDSDAISKSYQLAAHHVQISQAQLNHFQDSSAKQVLNQISNSVLDRKH
ncbi:hypothetical protein PtA15_1A569 [Puccinia triticina]|uniref:(2E,6E)-farnesyl diphosphate synthase n=1 Tax=Puccinia triticina TaxID=208348 RepID=A0ABY7C8B3_9BASI|nr:uncharacterized protein PtA15_1A569 [Puccinia triticina]WAQ81229.1 hypothetical protein PtA15_1A569 [Puccinia triticina]